MPLYERVLPERDLLPLALMTSTTMPLVMAITYLGVRSGDMTREHASTVVGAAVLTVLIFPALANMLRSEQEAAEPAGPFAIATHRVAGMASREFSRFLAFVSQFTAPPSARCCAAIRRRKGGMRRASPAAGGNLLEFVFESS